MGQLCTYTFKHKYHSSFYSHYLPFSASGVPQCLLLLWYTRYARVTYVTLLFFINKHQNRKIIVFPYFVTNVDKNVSDFSLCILSSQSSHLSQNGGGMYVPTYLPSYIIWICVRLHTTIE